MPEIILKDKSGTEQTYDYKKVSFRTPTEGEKAEFIFPNFAELEITENGEYAVPEGVDGYTKVKANVPVPTLISGAEFELDFSDGDIHIAAPDGYAFTGGTIIKPENLIPENIAKDVEIAGIVGTHEGGGGSVEGTATVTFCNYDGTELFSRPVFVGDDCDDPIAQGKINEPTRESTAQYSYAFSGWSLTQGGTASASALNVVTGDRTVYAAYTANVRYYTVRFWNGSVLDQESTWAYGSTPAYQGGAPVPEEGYAFDRWLPEISAVTGDMDYVAQFKSVKSVTRDIITRAITQYSSDTITATGTSAFEGCEALINVNMPNATSIGGRTFYACSALTSVNIPNVTSTSNNAFRMCAALMSIDLPNATELYGGSEFESCTALTSANIPNVTRMYAKTFYNCTKLASVRLPATPPSMYNSNAFSGINSACKFYIPKGSLTAYQNDTTWSSLTSKYSFVEEDR